MHSQAYLPMAVSQGITDMSQIMETLQNCISYDKYVELQYMTLRVYMQHCKCSNYQVKVILY